jgi:hypothetical protein
MHRRRFSRKSIALAGLIMTGAMVAGEAAQSADFTRPPVCAAPFEPWTEINLYFGRDIAGVGEVTEQQFRAFAREVVTPRFPDGLTILDGLGQFRDGQRIVRERAKLLVLLVPDRNDIAAEVTQIVREYKRRFRQQSVLRTETQLCLSFA